MSIALMTLAWELDISSTDKLVLLALADWANADGACWPSMAQLATKSGLTDRAVRTSIGRLRDAGHLTRAEVTGKGVNYTVHPGTPCPPERRSPRNETTVTPERRSPNTPVTTISTKASPSTKRACFVLPDDIPADAWAAFEDMRNANGKRMTPRARDLAVMRLRKLAEDGHPPGAVLEHSTLNGWPGLYPPKEPHNAKFRSNRGPVTRSGDGFIAALHEASGDWRTDH